MGRTSLSASDRTLVIGHRGSAATHPENTLASFVAAYDARAEAVESDVRLTSDGVAVLMHDADVSRTTDGQGLLHQLTLEQVRALDAGRGQSVPTLPELLELAASRGTGVVLEVKNLPGDPGYDPAHEGAADALLDHVKDFPEVPVLVVSFNPRSIERCLRSRDVETGFLATAAMDPHVALRYSREAGHAWVLPNVAAVLAAGEEFVGEVHAAGVRLGTWTANDPADVETLVGWGLDAIASDDPAAAVAIRGGV